MLLAAKIWLLHKVLRTLRLQEMRTPFSTSKPSISTLLHSYKPGPHWPVEVAEWQLVVELEAKNNVLGRDVLPNTLYRLLQLANRFENLTKLSALIDGIEGCVMKVRILLEKSPAFIALMRNTLNEEKVSSYIITMLHLAPTYADLK
jgi:hypothetical protein